MMCERDIGRTRGAPAEERTDVFTVGYILTGIGILAGFASELTKHRQGPPGLKERLHLGAGQPDGPSDGTASPAATAGSHGPRDAAASTVAVVGSDDGPTTEG